MRPLDAAIKGEMPPGKRVYLHRGACGVSVLLSRDVVALKCWRRSTSGFENGKNGQQKKFQACVFADRGSANLSRLWGGFSFSNLREKRCERVIRKVVCWASVSGKNCVCFAWRNSPGN